MATKVFVLILNYNHPQDTVKAANSILSSKRPVSTKIIVIDNGKKNLAKYFDNQIKNVIYLKSPGNIGFAAANNLGIKYALSRGATHILIMNPDVTVPVDFLLPLLETFDTHKKAGIVAPAHHEPNSKVYGMGGSINWSLAAFPHQNLKKLPNQVKQYELLTFACVLIKAEVFAKAGLMDERFFLYLEDVDYCITAKQAGYQLWLNPKVVITHNTSSSFADPRIKIWLSFVSCFTFIKKWYKFPHNLIPIIHTMCFYPFTYLLWTLRPKRIISLN